MGNQRHHQPQLAHYREIVLYDLDTGGGFRLREAVSRIETSDEIFNASLQHRVG